MNAIGRYQVERRLGGGGQGAVYLCRDSANENVRVAVKRHDRGLADRLRGGDLVTTVRQIPYAAPVLDVLPAEQSFVMPYYPDDEYVGLDSLIRSGLAARRDHQVAYCRVLLRLAIYLSAAHHRSLPLHGDLAPKNILIRRDLLSRRWSQSSSAEFPWLSGLVGRPVREVQEELDRRRSELCADLSVLVIDPWVYDRAYDDGRVFSTPNFSAPEQLENVATRITIATDVFAFGAIFYALFSGTASESVRARLIAEHNPSVPSQFEQIARGCLQTDPSRRYKVDQLVQAATWALAYLLDPDEYAFDREAGELLPPRPVIQKDVERDPGNTVRVMNRRLGVQDLSPPLRANESVRFESVGAANHYTPPEPVRRVADGWLLDRVKNATARRFRRGGPFTFFDGGEVRLDAVHARRSTNPPELLVTLQTSFTGYYRSRVTNEFCNRLLPTGRTLFEEYGGRLPDLTDSRLSNPLAVNYLVITSDGVIAVAKRAVMANNTEQTPDFQLPLVVTVSGTCEPSKCCLPDGRFDLTAAVAAEYEEEVFRRHHLAAEQIHHMGVARTTGFVYPFVFGYIECGKDRFELSKADRTADDGIREIAGYEFVPNSVDGIVAKLEELDRWRNLDGSRRRIEDSLMFCLYKYAHLLNLRDPKYPAEELDRMLNPPLESASG